jgi:hypothetical protein
VCSSDLTLINFPFTALSPLERGPSLGEDRFAILGWNAALAVLYLALVLPLVRRAAPRAPEADGGWQVAARGLERLGRAAALQLWVGGGAFALVLILRDRSSMLDLWHLSIPFVVAVAGALQLRGALAAAALRAPGSPRALYSLGAAVHAMSLAVAATFLLLCWYGWPGASELRLRLFPNATHVVLFLPLLAALGSCLVAAGNLQLVQHVVERDHDGARPHPTPLKRRAFGALLFLQCAAFALLGALCLSDDFTREDLLLATVLAELPLLLGLGMLAAGCRTLGRRLGARDELPTAHLVG